MEEQTLCSENLKFTVGKRFQFPAIFHRKDSRGFSFAENWKDESNLFADLPLFNSYLGVCGNLILGNGVGGVDGDVGDVGDGGGKAGNKDKRVS